MRSISIVGCRDRGGGAAAGGGFEDSIFCVMLGVYEIARNGFKIKIILNG